MVRHGCHWWLPSNKSQVIEAKRARTAKKKGRNDNVEVDSNGDARISSFVQRAKH